mgnify:CR=1 FL=1
MLAELTEQVFTVEIIEPLTRQAAQRLKELGYDKVRVKYGDGYFGWEEAATFDAIIVTCAANHIPPPLIKQLKEGGRMVIPVGDQHEQDLIRIRKDEKGFTTESWGGCRFVKLVGEHGWRDV